MKQVLIFATIIMLAGCTATPVKRNFPDAPQEIKVACPDLKQTQQTDKLSDVLRIVADNYGQYHECRAKVDAWNDWYNSQKQNFESVK